jgi:hypothetical protein
LSVLRTCLKTRRDLQVLRAIRGAPADPSARHRDGGCV